MNYKRKMDRMDWGIVWFLVGLSPLIVGTVLVSLGL